MAEFIKVADVDDLRLANRRLLECKFGLVQALTLLRSFLEQAALSVPTALRLYTDDLSFLF